MREPDARAERVPAEPSDRRRLHEPTRGQLLPLRDSEERKARKTLFAIHRQRGRYRSGKRSFQNAGGRIARPASSNQAQASLTIPHARCRASGGLLRSRIMYLKKVLIRRTLGESGVTHETRSQRAVISAIY